MITSILALFAAAKSRIALYLGGAAALLVAFAAVLFAGRRQGRDGERNRNFQNTIDHVEDAHAAQRDADRDPDPARRLREEWRRD